MPCGLGHILQNMDQYSAGIDFEIILIINCGSNKIESPYRQFLKNIPLTYNVFYRKTDEKQKKNAEKKKARYIEIKEKYPFIKTILFRDNLGQDFGAFNYGYKYLKEMNYSQDVLFMNSSLEGPYANDWLLKYYKLFHSREDVGLCGISLHAQNTNIKEKPFAPHVGSYLLYSNMKILKKVFKENICGADTDDKNIIIEEGEIGMSREILNAGYSICCTAAENFYYKWGVPWELPFGALESNRKI